MNWRQIDVSDRFKTGVRPAQIVSGLGRLDRILSLARAFNISPSGNMIGQEQGVAVGWPLNLGQDTIGWPLGLRLQFLHEYLEWPRMPDLALSSSGISTDSSSLDTMSIRSFFQDNTKTLGARLGLPMLDGAGNAVRLQQQQQRQTQHRPAFHSHSPVRPNSPAFSPVLQNRVQNANKARRRRHHGRSSTKQQQQHPSTSSTVQRAASSARWSLMSALSCARRHHDRSSTKQQQHLSPSSTVQGAASSAGWSLLSALSCARVPAEIGAAVNEDEEYSIPRAQLVVRETPSRKSDQDPELELPEGNSHERTAAPPPLPLKRNSSRQHMISLAKKLYDNIVFEDEELEMCSKQRRSTSGLSSDGASEWNPLFACSPQAARDQEKHEPGNDDGTSSRRAGTTTTMYSDQFLVQRASYTTGFVPLMTVVGRSNNNSDALL